MKKNFLFFLYFFIFFNLFSQSSNQVFIKYYGSRNYNFVERTNLRKYENGKYVGLLSREVSAFITPYFDGKDFIYEGNFYINQNVKKSMINVGISFDDYVPAKFIIQEDGNFNMIEDNGFPTFRSFPTYQKESIKLGDSWTAKAYRNVDPLEKGINTVIPIYVKYTYKGEQTYKGYDVYCVSADWATRYAMGTTYYDFNGDKDLTKATGSHKSNILIDKHTGITLVINDSVDEKFIYSDGKEVSFKGTISMFTEYPPTYEVEKLLPAIKRVAKLSDDEVEKLKDNFEDNLANKNTIINKQNDLYSEVLNKAIETTKNKNNSDIQKSESEKSIAVENTTAGIKLTIPNLQFEPDSSILIKGEYSRIDDIYEILKMVPQAQILIEGHTAKTGNDKGEMNLSVERAKAIAHELIKRGVNENRLICKGSGSAKPIADNSTAEGKKINRRVEITILK